MVFCNVVYYGANHYENNSHNPYFNRWFSAIVLKGDKTALLSLSQSLF